MRFSDCTIKRSRNDINMKSLYKKNVSKANGLRSVHKPNKKSLRPSMTSRNVKSGESVNDVKTFSG